MLEEADRMGRNVSKVLIYKAKSFSRINRSSLSDLSIINCQINKLLLSLNGIKNLVIRAKIKLGVTEE